MSFLLETHKGKKLTKKDFDDMMVKPVPWVTQDTNKPKTGKKNLTEYVPFGEKLKGAWGNLTSSKGKKMKKERKRKTRKRRRSLY